MRFGWAFTACTIFVLHTRTCLWPWSQPRSPELGKTSLFFLRKGKPHSSRSIDHRWHMYQPVRPDPMTRPGPNIDSETQPLETGASCTRLKNPSRHKHRARAIDRVRFSFNLWLRSRSVGAASLQSTVFPSSNGVGAAAVHLLLQLVTLTWWARMV
jgi:hypothetical protein